MAENSLENMCCVSWILCIKSKRLETTALFAALYQIVNILTRD